MEDDGADIGVAIGAVIGEGDDVGAVAGEIGAQFAFAVGAIGVGGWVAGDFDGVGVEGGIAEIAGLLHEVVVAELDSEGALAVGMSLGVGDAPAEALDNHGVGRRGAVIEQHLAADKLGCRLESGGRVGVGSFILSEGWMRKQGSGGRQEGVRFHVHGTPFLRWH